MTYRAWIKSLCDSYTCVLVWHLEPGLIACLIAMLVSLCGITTWIISFLDSYRDPPSGSGFDSSRVVTGCIVFWLTLIAEGLYLDRYVSRTFYGVGVYYLFIVCIQNIYNIYNINDIYKIYTINTKYKQYIQNI